MALDRIRREIEEERAQKSKAERRAEKERIDQKREYIRSIQQSLRCLRRLESRFWEFADEFARLCDVEVKHSSQSHQSLWGKMLGRSCATDEKPELYTKCDPSSYDSGNCHWIRLEAKPDNVYFEAR